MKRFLLSSLILVLVTTSFVLAQSTESGRPPTLKEFGWSLRQNAEDEKPAESDDVIRVETNLVVNDIFVSDKQGRAITGLTKNDFIVTEDGQPQTIESFALGSDAKVPRSIVLIMDYSGSLLPYIETSVEAAKILVDQLNPQDRMAIVTDDVELLTGFTRDKTVLKEKLDLLKAKALSGNPGRSEQYSALYATLNELFDKEDVRPIVFFQTDGDQISRLKGIQNYSDSNRTNFSFEDLLTAAENARTTIYTIMPGMKYAGLSKDEQMEKAQKAADLRTETLIGMGRLLPLKKEDSEARERRLKFSIKIALTELSFLNSVTKSTGGWTSILETPEQVGNIYAQILSLINRRYVIGYYPTNETRDGKRRMVKIEVRGHPEYIIWDHKSYFARRALQN